jgi:hypothetical protein
MHVSWQQVTARRIARHFLNDEHTDIPDAVGAMCGAHAQVMSAAEMSIGVRVAGITRADVRAAIGDTLTKTFGPRGTVHLLATRDLGLFSGALSQVPAQGGLASSLGMTAARTDAVVAAIGDALRGEPLTIDELGDAIVARTGAWAGELVIPAFQGMWPRWRLALATAAHRGVLCFGPSRGRGLTYTTPPPFEPVPAADVALLHRYLHAYGPATTRDFARWLSAPLGWAQDVAARADLDRVEVHGARADSTVAWVSRGDLEFPQGPAHGIRLLPYFDPYQVGSHPREQLFPGRAAERALARGQAGNFPVLLIDGVVGGVWHQKRSGQRIAVTVEPLVRLTARQSADLHAQVHRVGEILEGTAQLTIGAVTVGPHA